MAQNGHSCRKMPPMKLQNAIHRYYILYIVFDLRMRKSVPLPYFCKIKLHFSRQNILISFNKSLPKACIKKIHNKVTPKNIPSINIIISHKRQQITPSLPAHCSFWLIRFVSLQKNDYFCIIRSLQTRI